jgi:hypothetical protein
VLLLVLLLAVGLPVAAVAFVGVACWAMLRM